MLYKIVRVRGGYHLKIKVKNTFYTLRHSNNKPIKSSTQHNLLSQLWTNEQLNKIIVNLDTMTFSA